MLEQPTSPTASHTKQQVFDHYLYRLQSEIHTILEGEEKYEERLKSLETDLAAFKRACLSLENDNRILAEENRQLKEKYNDLEKQVKTADKRVVCVIDGDGTIFRPDIIAQGQQGGRYAAKQLSESVQYCLETNSPVWVYIFYNRRGLVDAFTRAGSEYREARLSFDDFVAGFNQACERFLMVDVGSGKEAADAKIRAVMEDQSRSLQTFKILFGGCHDNGYIHTLHSLITSGHHDKLVLLPGYNEIASEIVKLQLPVLKISDLFVQEKIAIASPSPYSPRASPPSQLQQVNARGPPPGLRPPSGKALHEPETPPADTVHSNLESTTDGVGSVKQNNNPSTYRSVLQAFPQNQSYSPSSKANDVIDSPGVLNPVVQPLGKSRHINRNIPLSQHDPPPCTLFYLANNGCKHGNDCRFGHDYILEHDDYEIMRHTAKKVPCPTVNRGEMCNFGENCCYGHVCPFALKCHFLKQGKCKFVGPSMHRDN